jgi:hypothetical protein
LMATKFRPQKAMAKIIRRMWIGFILPYV